MKREKRPDPKSNNVGNVEKNGFKVAPGNNYMDYVSKFLVQKGEAHSHTRIPDKSLSIGGAFMIPRSDIPEFYSRYYKHVFVDKKQEYLTEKQQPTNGPGLIDFDFRYASDVEERLHTKANIMDVIFACMRVFTNVYKFPSVSSNEIVIPFYVFEKPTVNMQADFTKDGIHMVISKKSCLLCSTLWCINIS